MDTIYNSLITLFRSWVSAEPGTFVALPGAGSSRRYFRLGRGENSAIGVYHPDKRENEAFLAFTQHFLRHHLPVPEIYATDPDHDVYLIEDLGDTTLYDLIIQQKEAGLFPEALTALFREAIRRLVSFQVTAGRDFDYSLCYPTMSFDRQAMMWDLNYFKYYFARLTPVLFDELKLDNDFESLTAFLLQADGNFFQYRDFQSRNIMVTGRGLYFIDYQGGRRGALQYDLASLLYQAKAAIPQPVRDELLDYYMDVAGNEIPIDRKTFKDFYHGYLLIRLLQVLGAYGRRGLVEHKGHFLRSIPFAVDNIRWFLGNADLTVSLPELYRVLEQIVALPAWPAPEETKDKLLHVRLNSFAYPRGIPDDLYGHGGGFVFDCRILPNPGKHEEFRFIPGDDEAVVRFMEEKEEVRAFLGHVFGLVDQAVASYVSRGFTNLTVSFGCTGGQHRSVFCAQKMAEHLGKNNKIVVSLVHRERERWMLK
jgi:aminoglycoside/choline kinase family phosphotransferase